MKIELILLGYFLKNKKSAKIKTAIKYYTKEEGDITNGQRIFIITAT